MVIYYLISMYRMVSVIGGNTASRGDLSFSFSLGSLLAKSGFTVVCGGGGGVMEAVSRGCSSADGTVVGILPGEDPSSSNDCVSIPIPTGLGVSRNRIIALSGQVICAVGGSYGTLSEIAFALQAHRPVCCYGTWSGIEGVTPVTTPEEALEFVLGKTKGRDAQC